VAGIPPSAADEVLVVDNGSDDRTAHVARAAGARVVRESRRGYGAACLAGSRAARGDLLVFMDADGSFDPAEIPALVAPLMRDESDLVLGSRALRRAARDIMPGHQRFGNWLAAQLLSRLYGLQVTDLGPFRALRRHDLLDLHMSEMTYGWPVEMMVKAARMGYRVREVPVSYGPRLGGRSKVSGTLKGSVVAGYRILHTILRYAHQPIRRHSAVNERE
jgi:glycosyltransferase involved in cell wall biosynthesis